MSKHHSSVNYVEPNLSQLANDWKVNNGLPRAPRLEDYCMMLNIEVEVFKRDNVTTSTSDTDGNGNQVYVMSARKLRATSDFVVSFMGGTRVNCHDKNNSTVPYLTTHYADMTTDDLYDYGTTEMIGIKSVDIEYQSSCVPIITINFTDVRGLSLFQPTELSRQNSYQGVGGINADNIAQSFFQCFFRVPMPKYTITLKGYYGKPVTYEVACDKFTTSFNSQTGDFDINTRFIGYSYSFMTDVSMDALLAAPYCSYIGKDYWEQKKNDGTFVVPRKNSASSDDVDKMPTLIEIRNTINDATNGSDTDNLADEAIADASGNDIVSEIDELTSIKNIYESWYVKLNAELTSKYGKNRVFLFQEATGNREYYRILVLFPSNDNILDFSNVYNGLSDEFKRINGDLYSAIEKYNKNTTRKSLTNVSSDFADYIKVHVFKPLFLDPKGNVIFNGFDTTNTLPRTDIVNNVLLQTNRVNENKDENDLNAKIIQRKKYQLSYIYNDGVSQYIDAFSIAQDYEYITKRINALQLEANKSYDERTKKERTKLLNAYMLRKLGWYPSVENFTRIMMAHVDTLMEIIYKCAEECKDRTADDLGVTIGSDGICCDVASNSKNYVPPFPRVVKDVLGDDGIVKKEDAWLSDVNNGSLAFREIDVVNGLFDAVNEFTNQVQANEVAVSESNRETLQEGSKTLLKRPVCSQDFFITKNPWGDINETIEDTTYRTLAGKIALRMQHTILLNVFSSFSKWWSDDVVKVIGAADAANFHDLNSISNTNFIQGLQTTLTVDFIKNVITENNSQNPWGKKSLCDSNYVLTRYSKYYKNSHDAYPFQDVSFSDNGDMVKSLNNMSGKGTSGGKYDEYAQTSIVVGGGNNVENEDVLSIKSGAFGFLRILRKKDIDNYKAIFDSLTDTDIDGYSDKFAENIKRYFNDDTVSFSGNTWCYDHMDSDFNKKESSKVDIDGAINNDNIKNVSYQGSLKKEAYTILALTPHIGYLGDLKSQLDTVYNEYTIFMPRLISLQIGAICKLTKNDVFSTSINTSARNRLGIQSEEYTPLVSFINRINGVARLYFANRFTEWASGKENNKSINKLYSLLQSGTGLKMNWFKSLYETVLVMIGNKYFFNTNKSKFYMKQNSSKIDLYLDSFLTKLKELYTYTSSDGDTSNQVHFSPSAKTNDDMRKSLYNYLKQLYDKWIPTSSRDEWYLNNFFSDGTSSEKQGNKFYFIDSYYNKINQKLIINPSRLVEKINALLSYKDVNVMMLGFMADVYAINKCMLMSIQNFADLSKNGSMDEMFKPIPYNDVDWKHLNKRTSFVIIYPYQPSRNLNVANNEFNNDGFMLNDENETPMAIRSKENPEYYIPAFGVTYGSQYQSYFKNVNVNMNSPVATQQSIMAKHVILQDSSNSSKSAKAAVGQDLYDIYATQSYTCDVTMLGCAWVQPLMYFVLLNIPMFRGSYLIMKVKHSIRPGDFTTTFTGCRMANVSTSLIEDIFTDDDNASDSASYLESQRERRADVDNDCPYKVYPLFNEYDGTYTWPNDKSEESFARTVYAAWKKAKPEVNDSVIRAIVCQEAVESTWGKSDAASYYNLGGVVKHGSQAGKNYTYQRYNSLDEFVKDKIASVLDSHWSNWSRANSPTEYFSIIHSGKYRYSKTPVGEYEKSCMGCLNRVNNAISTSSTSTSSSKSGSKEHDVYEGLFQAIQKSCSSTPSISVMLKKTVVTDGGKKYLWITQDNGSTDKLGNVFDVILNGYYDYVQELYWVYNGDNSLKKEPLRISVIPSENVKSGTRRVKLYNTASPKTDVKITKQEDVNAKFVMAITKKYGSLNTELPQIVNKNVFNTSGIINCNDLVRTSGSNYISPVSGKREKILKELFDGHIPTSKSEVERYLTTVTVQARVTKGGDLKNVSFSFHKKLASKIKDVFNDLANIKDFWLLDPVGTYSWRKKVGKESMSSHSYGIALDINPSVNPCVNKNGSSCYYGKNCIYGSNGRPIGVTNESYKSITMWTNNAIVQCFTRHGFGWGGGWSSRWDAMHFSYDGN